MSRTTVHVTIGARTHEEAAVVSARFQLPLANRSDFPGLLDSFTAGMQGMNAWAEDNGVIIGHIKGYVSWDQEAVMISTTGSDVQVKGSTSLPEPPCAADVGTAAIVFGVELHAMAERMEQFVEAALEKLGFAVAIEHEEEHHHEHGEDGCCEHDHHHDHGEDCCCEHDHHHDHDHVHGENCCGEHDHHHDHVHGEDCCGEHGHDHNHVHGADCCGEHGHDHQHDHDHTKAQP